MGAYRPESEIGRVEWHCSDEGSGPDVGLLLRLSEMDFIWCGDITRTEGDDAGISDAGWHIVHHNGSGRAVVATCHDHQAAQDLMEAIAASVRGAA